MTIHNIHDIHQKYQHSDMEEMMSDPDFKRAFNSTPLFSKGNFGMFIAPPETEEFLMAIAASTCSLYANRVFKNKVPKMNSCTYIDTFSSKAKLKADLAKVKSSFFNKRPRGFNVVSAKTLYSTKGVDYDPGLINRKTFESVTSYIENHHGDVECIFVTIDSLIFAPCNFYKDKFDQVINWAARMTAQGKTVILISRYLIPQINYFANHMDFIINCVPDQRAVSSDMCVFSMHWLSLKETKNSEGIDQSRYYSSVHPHSSFMAVDMSGGKRLWAQSLANSFIYSIPK